MRRRVPLALVCCVVFVSAAAAPPADAAVCSPVRAYFEIEIGAGFTTYAQRVRTRGIGCRKARQALRACGRSPYSPAGWRGSQRRGRGSDGLLLFVLTSGSRRIHYRTADDSQLPCSNPIFPRRPGGVAHGPLVLSARGLPTLIVGTRRRAAERSSGLDLRSFGLSCARSYVRRQVEVSFADDSDDPVVAQVMISDPNIPTTAGLRVGDPVVRIADLYGAQARFIGDLGVGQGTDFLIDPVDTPDHQYAIWTNDGRVTLIVAGRRGQTAADEYCA